MPATRFQPADRLPGATAFSREEALRGGASVVRLLKANRWLWRPLAEACDLDQREGRRRGRGHWELIAVAFVVSDYIDIQPFWDEAGEDLWQLCGFEAKPSYDLTWRRLRELAEVADAFLDSAGQLIRRAHAQDPRVMAHVHFDNTEDETHAALIHDCAPGACPHRRRRGSARRPARQPTVGYREERHKLNALDEETAEAERERGKPESEEMLTVGGRAYKRVRVNGCYYRVRDAEAGVRAYTGPRGAKRFWLGYYSGKAVDHFTGGVVPFVASAGVQEHVIFEEHYDLVARLLGKAPQTVIGDKGLSVRSAFEKATLNGSAPVFPWRPGNGDARRHDHETHDRHGVPRCQHCGANTRFVRFSLLRKHLPAEQRDARMWVMCTSGRTPECAKEQTISCSADYRLLVPLWRDNPLYHELRASHSSYEAAHDYWRDRYKVAADDIGVRPKVVDIGFHRLRANVACLVEWLRICFMQGWLGNPRTAERRAERKYRERAERAVASLTRARYRAGLMEPYGEAALGLFPNAQRTPPSRRARGPNGQTALDIPGT